ncbi:MAG: DUF1653 domain-containing protein [Patescibacteria group bacterium]
MRQSNTKIQPGIYRHYKGGTYRVLGVAKHSETLEEMVIYEALYDNPISKLWARPLSMFLDEVEWQGKKAKRFTFVVK